MERKSGNFLLKADDGQINFVDLFSRLSFKIVTLGVANTRGVLLRWRTLPIVTL